MARYSRRRTSRAPARGRSRRSYGRSSARYTAPRRRRSSVRSAGRAKTVRIVVQTVGAGNAPAQASISPLRAMF